MSRDQTIYSEAELKSKMAKAVAEGGVRAVAVAKNFGDGRYVSGLVTGSVMTTILITVAVLAINFTR